MNKFSGILAKSWKIAATLSLAFSLQLGLGTAPSALAEGPADPAPVIAPKVVNENAGKKILFDNTHGQTAGAADWVIDGGFSDFGQALAGEGFEVKELRKTTPLTYSDLSDYEVFVVAEPNVPFKQSEQAAMEQYVENGGSIFFIGDHYNADRNKNRWDGSESINGFRRGAWEDPAKGMSSEEKNSAAMQGVVSSDWLSDNFGVRFRYNALGDVTANQIVTPDQAFGITEGVQGVAMHAGSTLAITDPAKAKGIVYLPETDDAWGNAVDQGVYNGGGIEEGPYVAVSKVGLGKAAFIGDSSPVEDASPKYLREENGAKKTTYDGFKEQDDAELLVNLVDWLATQENYVSLQDVPGLELDEVTALHPFESPEASTEPQPEPWSAPAAGYKWWDPSTFKPGSYGGPIIDDHVVYGFEHQNVLPNAEDFQIRVAVDNLPANSTLSGFSVGIYLTGGTQIAKIQNADGTWPSAYGYGSTFSLTANGQGRAFKDLTVRIKPGVSGTANLRLRQNGGNLLTKSVSIADVPAEPLPEENDGTPELISISEARMQPEGKLVTVQGTITTEPGIFGGQAFYVQDETGGIYVYQSASGYHQGDEVKITAPLALYNTELELANLVSIEKTGTAAELPAPKAAPSVSDENQGQLLEIRRAEIRNIVTAAPSGSFEFDAVSEDVSNHVRVDARTGLTLADFPFEEGQFVDLRGISAIFKGVYQLKPRGLGDISLSTPAEEPGEEPSEEPAEGAPGQPVLSDDNGHDTGLRDGNYTVTMNMWWGNNGTELKLYENDALIGTLDLTDASPSAQSHSFDFSGKKNGTYTYIAELINAEGTAKSQPLVVVVSDAAPGKPVLSNDNWDGNGEYLVSMNLWWGTSGSEYRLYENGQLIDTQSLSEVTPGAQQAASKISGKEPGTYEYVAELVNAAGETSSEVMTVVVK